MAITSTASLCWRHHILCQEGKVLWLILQIFSNALACVAAPYRAYYGTITVVVCTRQCFCRTSLRRVGHMAAAVVCDAHQSLYGTCIWSSGVGLRILFSRYWREGSRAALFYGASELYSVSDTPLHAKNLRSSLPVALLTRPSASPNCNCLRVHTTWSKFACRHRKT